MSRFLCDAMRALTPYTPGEQPREGAFIKLNTNESPFSPSPAVIRAVCAGEAEKLNLYSDPTLFALKQALAARFGVSPENAYAGNGSDEVLALAMRAFGGDGFAAPALTYGFYPVLANFFGIPYQTFPLDENLRVRAGDFRNVGRAVVLANPNAPTGIFLGLDEIEEIARSNPGHVVIADEAYVDFGGESAAALLPKYENLLVVGTFSKAWNLAGARLGYAIGSEELIGDLERLRYSFHPYNVNRLSILAGAAALSEEPYYVDCRKRVMETRENTRRALTDMGFDVTDSRANFLFARPPRGNAEEVFLSLRARGVLVRYFGEGPARAYLRITVGTRAQMDEVIRKCEEILRGEARA